MDEQISIRLKSFGYSLLSMAVLAVLGFLASSDFTALITQNFGESAFTAIVLLVVPEAVKWLRNYLLTQGMLGSATDRSKLI